MLQPTSLSNAPYEFFGEWMAADNPLVLTLLNTSHLTLPGHGASSYAVRTSVRMSGRKSMVLCECSQLSEAEGFLEATYLDLVLAVWATSPCVSAFHE